MSTATAMKVRRSITSRLVKWTTPDNLRSADYRIFTSDRLVTNTYWALTDHHPLWAKLSERFPYIGEPPSTGYHGSTVNNAYVLSRSGADIARVIPEGDDVVWVPIERGEITEDLGPDREPRNFCYIVERPARGKSSKPDRWALDPDLIDLIAGPGAVIERQEDMKQAFGPWRITFGGEVMGYVMPIRLA